MKKASTDDTSGQQSYLIKPKPVPKVNKEPNLQVLGLRLKRKGYYTMPKSQNK